MLKFPPFLLLFPWRDIKIQLLLLLLLFPPLVLRALCVPAIRFGLCCYGCEHQRYLAFDYFVVVRTSEILGIWLFCCYTGTLPCNPLQNSSFSSEEQILVSALCQWSCMCKQAMATNIQKVTSRAFAFYKTGIRDHAHLCRQTVQTWM